MNVLYLINYAGKAGTEKYVDNLVRILGHDKIKPYFAYNLPGELSEKMKKSDVPCFQVDMGKSSIFKAAKELAAYCRENSIDVIHAQYPRENIIALLSKRHYSKPRVVLTNHLTLRLSGASGFVWRRLNKHFTPKNHRIIAVCNEGADIMRQNGVCPEKIQVIFNGIEPAGPRVQNQSKRSELGLSDDCFVMTIFARFAPEKGLDFLVDALCKVKAEAKRPFCCLICGDGELFPHIQQRITELGLEQQIKLLGFRKDTAQILACSDIYLNTSNSNEAMSFAILEAMNAGLPLVVTDVGGNRDLAENRIRCGYVTDIDDVDGFSGHVLELMDSHELCQSLSQNAIEKVAKHFDLSTLAEDVYNAYF